MYLTMEEVVLLYSQKIEAMLEKVQKAPRYTGGEMNAVLKNWDDVQLKFAFCFPDTYEVAMSHLGMKIIYNTVDDLHTKWPCPTWA